MVLAHHDPVTTDDSPIGARAGRWLAVLLPFFLLLYLCWLMARPFVQVLLWTVVLAVVFAPAHRRIAARVASPSTAALISTLLVVLTVLLPLSAITAAVVREAAGIAEHLQAKPASLLRGDTPIVGPVIAWLSQYVDVERFASAQFIGERLQVAGTMLASGALGLVGGLMSALVQTVLVVFTLFYFFRDGAAIRHAAYDVLPLESAQTRDIAQRTREVIGATVYGVLVISAIQGLLGTLIFWMLGLPSPLLWGVVMFFLSMIPMAGAFIVWVPAALYLALTGAYLKALMLVGFGVLVIGSIDNFLSPRLVGKRARLHELLIFFSVLGGIQVFGVLGVVLGPVVVALTLAMLEIVRQANRPAAETIPEDTLLERQAAVRRGDP
jgi:predicted PurR-regulated permease PerM